MLFDVLACDPSDPSLRFRVSNAQVHNWIDCSANAFQQQNQSRKKAAEAEDRKKNPCSKPSDEERENEEAGDEEAKGEQEGVDQQNDQQHDEEQQQHAATKSTKSTAPPSAGVTSASISCAIRRFRHYASATSGEISGGGGGTGSPGSPGSGGADDSGSPSNMMMSSARNRQQQHPYSPSSAARTSQLLLNSGNSTSVRRAAAVATSVGRGQQQPPQSMLMQSGGHHQPQQQQQHGLVETIVGAVQLPTRSPVVDVEVARIWGQFPLLSARDTSMEMAFGASRLHRQLIQSIRAHPKSLTMSLPPQQQQNKSILRMPLFDAVHGQRIVIPVRSTSCISATDEVTSSSSSTSSFPHPPMCLLGLFLLAAQAGTVVRPEAELCGVTTANAQCTNGEALLSLCPHCQAPLTVGALYMDRLTEKILAAAAAAEENGSFDAFLRKEAAASSSAAAAENDDNEPAEVTHVAVDICNFPHNLRIVPI